MKLEVQQPSPERQDVFDEYVKPILIAADTNNALDTWMFGLTQDEKPDFDSIVFVSSKHKKIFIIEDILIWEKAKKEPNLYEKMINPYDTMTKKPLKTSNSKYTNVRRTWTSAIGYWDLRDYTFSGLTVESGSKVPTLEELSKDIDFDLWVEINKVDYKNLFYQGNLLYHSISKKWKLSQIY